MAAASDLFVPTTPVGPRFSHPATYSPGSGPPSGPSTRPSAFGTVAVRSSNGTPGSGTLWYPTLRNTIWALIVSYSPVPVSPALSSRRVRSTVSPETRSVPSIFSGRSQKRRVSLRSWPAGAGRPSR